MAKKGNLSAQQSARSSRISRRGFLGSAAGLAAAAATGGAGIVLEPLAGGSKGRAADIGPLTPEQRRQRAFEIRVEAAEIARDVPLPDHPNNGDEEAYANKIGSYSKGLPHNSAGEVDLNSYNAMIAALTSGDPEDFENIPMGCSNPSQQRRLVNPQAGLAFDLEGTDSHQLAMPPAPALASAWAAGEAVELYWMALLRDVEFTDYARSPLAAAACAELSQLSDFRGPRQGGAVTPQTLFRDNLPGTLAGPFVSQFLLKPTPFGAEAVERKMRTLRPGVDYMTSFSEWLEIQRGCQPTRPQEFDPVRRYIRSARDLAEWVHNDVLFQAYFNAMLILLHPPAAGGLGCPPNPGNPYVASATQEGFGTFGGPYMATILCEVATRALKAVWYQKWCVHRRLRPEAYGGRVHRRATGQAGYPLHSDILNSQALSRTFSRYGTGLLPQVYPEGSPLHPSYGAGHGTVAGACVTVLKALFDESFVVPDPVVPNPGGRELVAYRGADAGSLTVGGELNKLASNIAVGRDMAGIHYRSEGIESFKLGEAVALSVLRDQRGTYNEDFAGFTFTRFDGTPITV
ncbi:MAG TPA: vanadium-dependent haloperoxidase [Candidatus Xenobia bacterium]|nr:vanadium-dependent haloperoxidase [Candidatus Xenobia bacterium]